MQYVTYKHRLESCGWKITDESHGGNIYPHFFRYDYGGEWDNETAIELYCAANKDGSPGKILRAFKGGKKAQI